MTAKTREAAAFLHLLRRAVEEDVPLSRRQVRIVGKIAKDHGVHRGMFETYDNYLTRIEEKVNG